MAISAIKSNIKKIFFCKKIYHDVVVHVPNFQLSAKSSSFFCAFFLHFYGVLFFWTPYIYVCVCPSVGLSLCPSVRLSVCLSICLSVLCQFLPNLLTLTCMFNVQVCGSMSPQVHCLSISQTQSGSLLVFLSGLVYLPIFLSA